MNVAFPSLGRFRLLLLLAFAAVLCFRLAHINLLWADEDYHLAAAIQILHGKVPYRDFWYDKPPLTAYYYLLIGGHAQWALRILDLAYVALACALAFALAKQLWTEVHGWVAAALLAFFTTFYLPSAVIPFAADALMLVPHLAAVLFAQRKQPLAAGACAGVAFLANTKALFVLLSSAVWLPAELLLLLLGFLLPSLAAFLLALSSGAWNDYVAQVWKWGLTYAAKSPVVHPILTATTRTLDWLGFHSALALSVVFGWLRLGRSERVKLAAWLVLSFAGVSLGSRFAPHYFLQLLPAAVILSSHGIVSAWRERRALAATALCLLLAVPLVRFGPRYLTLAYDNLMARTPKWGDIALDLDSQAVARAISKQAQPGDTLFVWGYRPDIYVYTRLIAPGRFWDSQPLTGVPADRHLSSHIPIFNAAASAANRSELIRSHPTWIVDGLGLLNPKLEPGVYPDLKIWLTNYHLVARTKLSRIYRKTTAQ